jgi:hypothetical protein
MGGFPSLTTRGRRRAGRCESTILFQRLECPDLHSVSHAAARDCRGFDGLEYLLLGGAGLHSPAHMGLYAILQTPGRYNA